MSIRYRNVLITIQRYAWFRDVQWHNIPHLKRVTCQFEDKGISGLPVDRPHIQAFLEFDQQVARSTLTRHMPHIHFPTKKELAWLDHLKGPLKVDYGRRYCSDPTKRIEGTESCIWVNGVWVSGADFLQELLIRSEPQEEVVFNMPTEKPRSSFMMFHEGEEVEVLGIGTEKLQHNTLSATERNEEFIRSGKIVPLLPVKKI